MKLFIFLSFVWRDLLYSYSCIIFLSLSSNLIIINTLTLFLLFFEIFGENCLIRFRLLGQYLLKLIKCILAIFLIGWMITSEKLPQLITIFHIQTSQNYKQKIQVRKIKFENFHQFIFPLLPLNYMKIILYFQLPSTYSPTS